MVTSACLKRQRHQESNTSIESWNEMKTAGSRRRSRDTIDRETRGVSHCGLVIYVNKYIKAKEELWKLKYFTMQKYNCKKIL
jgi:hypothetical protein